MIDCEAIHTPTYWQSIRVYDYRKESTAGNSVYMPLFRNSTYTRNVSIHYKKATGIRYGLLQENNFRAF